MFLGKARRDIPPMKSLDFDAASFTVTGYAGYWLLNEKPRPDSSSTTNMTNSRWGCERSLRASLARRSYLRTDDGICI